MTVNYTLPELVKCYGTYIKNDYWADIKRNPCVGFNAWNYGAHNPDEIIRERAQIIFAVLASALSAYALLTTMPGITAIVLSAALINHSIQFFRVSETKSVFDFDHKKKLPDDDNDNFENTSTSTSTATSTPTPVSTAMRPDFKFAEPFSDDDNY